MASVRVEDGGGSELLGIEASSPSPFNAGEPIGELEAVGERYAGIVAERDSLRRALKVALEASSERELMRQRTVIALLSLSDSIDRARESMLDYEPQQDRRGKTWDELRPSFDLLLRNSVMVLRALAEL